MTCVEQFFAGNISVLLHKTDKEEIKEFYNILVRNGLDKNDRWVDGTSILDYFLNPSYGPYQFCDRGEYLGFSYRLNGGKTASGRKPMTASQFIETCLMEEEGFHSVTDEEYLLALTGGK